jgi:hypothetical protein
VLHAVRQAPWDEARDERRAAGHETVACRPTTAKQCERLMLLERALAVVRDCGGRGFGPVEVEIAVDDDHVHHAAVIFLTRRSSRDELAASFRRAALE